MSFDPNYHNRTAGAYVVNVPCEGTVSWTVLRPVAEVDVSIVASSEKERSTVKGAHLPSPIRDQWKYFTRRSLQRHPGFGKALEQG